MPDFFYVSAQDTIRGKLTTSLMFGPLPSKEAADMMEPIAYKLACDLDPRSPFWAWGVTKLTLDSLPPLGTINNYLQRKG
jgi:hypothetical protein